MSSKRGLTAPKFHMQMSPVVIFIISWLASKVIYTYHQLIVSAPKINNKSILVLFLSQCQMSERRVSHQFDNSINRPLSGESSYIFDVSGASHSG